MSYKSLPSVDEILRDPRMAAILENCTHELALTVIREELGRIREEITREKNGPERHHIVSLVIRTAAERINKLQDATLKRVINGSGVVLHTNLGRAPLSREAAACTAELTQGYTNLELELASGKRGSRYQHLESTIMNITGAEAALVVNNNAAAVLLVLNTLGRDREVIVSRGQLVEIGGSFRIPEIMAMSGARMVEVGTTNKTHPADFAGAVNDHSAMLLAVHTSNYRIVGFTQEVELAELVEIGRQKGLPVVQDLGSGSLIDLSPWGLKDEPTVQKCLQTGVDLVTFSGDKLLGGPQAGIIAGKRKYIEQMKKNHLLRALRVDKLTIAALEATLKYYVKGDPTATVPVLEMLTRKHELLQQQAEGLAAAIRGEMQGFGKAFTLRVIEIMDKVGGGAYPLQDLPGYGVELTLEGDAEMLARQLRNQEPAMISRIQEGSLIISARTLLAGEDKLIPALLRRALEETKA